MTNIAHWHANYKGKVDSVGQIMGPNTMGEYFMAVEVVYDAENDKTRVGFALAARNDKL